MNNLSACGDNQEEDGSSRGFHATLSPQFPCNRDCAVHTRLAADPPDPNGAPGAPSPHISTARGADCSDVPYPVRLSKQQS